MLAAFVVPVLWVSAALCAGSLPHGRTAAALRLRALLTLLAVVAAATAGLLLAPPILTVLAIGTLGSAVPRLVRLRAAARGVAEAGPRTPAPPALRAAGAHPAVAVPVQATAYGSAVLFGVSTVVNTTAATALWSALAVATAATVGWHATRHRRLLARALVVRSRSAPLGVLDIQQL